MAAAPTPAQTALVSVAEPGFVFFDEFFAGSSDAEKFAAMDLWHRNNTGAGPRRSVVFAPRTYSVPTLNLWAGMRLEGANSSPVREYNTGTTFSCTATNQFQFAGVSNGGYGYPSSGAPRDISIQNILFNGGSTKNWLAPQATYNPSVVLWMSTIHNCGWTNWLSIINGYLDGVTISGVTHVQGCYGTPFRLGGSENNIFADGFAFMDSAAAYSIVGKGLPFIDTHMDKSRIGRIMVTSRQTGYGLLVSGGSSQTIDGYCADAQSGDPTYGAAIKVTGGDGLVFSGCSFKGMASNPAAAPGGMTENRGWIQITGGQQTVFSGCQWRRDGNNQPSTSFPTLFVGPQVGRGQVKVGVNAYSGFAAQPAVIQQSLAGQVSRVPDETCTLVTGS